MFEKFGEFDSAEEINTAALEQLRAGNKEAVFQIAEENGLDREDAEDFMNGDLEKLTTTLSAALGKIQRESKEIEIDGVLEDWKNILIEMCAEDMEMAEAVRRKGKRLAEYMARLIAFSFANKRKISDAIVKITKVNHNGNIEPLKGPLYLGFPNKTEVKRIVREYYLD